MEGIQAAKKKGVYKGRPRPIDATKIRTLMGEGLGASAVAKKLGIGRASVYRTLIRPVQTPIVARPGMVKAQRDEQQLGGLGKWKSRERPWSALVYLAPNLPTNCSSRW